MNETEEKALETMEEMDPGTILKFFQLGYYLRNPKARRISSIVPQDRCLGCNERVGYGNQEGIKHARSCPQVKELIDLGTKTTKQAVAAVRNPALLEVRIKNARNRIDELRSRVRYAEDNIERLERRIVDAEKKLGLW